MTPLDRIRACPLAIDVRGKSVRVVVAADKYTVANVSEGMNDREQYARLFAAAPDLYRALAIAIERLHLSNCEGEEDGYLAVMHDAIFKAQGR